MTEETGPFGEPNPTKVGKRFYRVRELCEMTGLKKGHIYSALHEGKLIGLKLGKALLITAESVETFLRSAVPWTPPGAQ